MDAELQEQIDPPRVIVLKPEPELARAIAEAATKDRRSRPQWVLALVEKELRTSSHLEARAS